MSGFKSERAFTFEFIPMGRPRFTWKIGVDFRDGHPDEFLMGITEDPARCVIDVQYFPRRIDPEDGIDSAIETEFRQT